MNHLVFVLFSGLYVVFLAVVDGLFNRLVFREHRKLTYHSPEKKDLYKRWEWSAIGVVFLIILPILLPIFAALYLGGLNYVFLYVIVLLLVPWDMIFGALVFDDFLGDTPSIAIPLYGWFSMPLLTVTAIRIDLALILISTKISLGL